MFLYRIIALIKPENAEVCRYVRNNIKHLNNYIYRIVITVCVIIWIVNNNYLSQPLIALILISLMDLSA